MADDRFASKRETMVKRQLARRGIADERVLAAFRRVPREAFVRPELAKYAYDDNPLPIGEEQTISQPYVVAQMTEAARVKPGARVLDVGTGSGYSAAILAELAGEVIGIERFDTLADRARETLRQLGYANVEVLAGDGTRGVPDRAQRAQGAACRRRAADHPRQRRRVPGPDGLHPARRPLRGGEPWRRALRPAGWRGGVDAVRGGDWRQVFNTMQLPPALLSFEQNVSASSRVSAGTRMR
jgi:SAM-dependent methyltransferase